MSENSSYRGRFAPSPTGALHLGLARTALLGWLRARRLSGSFVLRIEDIDGPRVVAGSAERLAADLAFLGLDWDEGPDRGGPYAPYVQSQRLGLYREALAQLGALGRVYACSCSRKEIAIASAPHGPSEFGPVYSGRCRGGPERPEGPHALRFRVPERLPIAHDARLGELDNLARGDFVVQRADGLVSYQLAVVVDDIAMRMTEVLRGEDLAGCTGWQLALYEALGAPAPAFMHVPLLLDESGKRLAKRDGARSIGELRQSGVSADVLVGALAASVGLVPEGTRIMPAELIADFEIERIVATTIDWSRALKMS
jgi:glutamyl-tRNA synthetase